ncbi:ABC transporter ATP-binding protein [Bacillus sp. 1P06AnD]|uniref:ABC transporter ATP-binding protein n=1 Tax=Bacillus sp. 1P06AnD TaxID=3132208 RepID=UPI0039A18029
MNRLEARQVAFSYHRKELFRGLNIGLSAGECIGILGPSGSGKTTIGRLLSGYEVPSSGTVLLNGQELPRKGFCPVQLVGQHPQLAFDERMKMGNALKETGMDPVCNQDILELVGIKNEWLDRYPIELSGGELQRFCIARALNRDTKYVIADEMTAMFDAITQARLMKLLKSIQNERNIGILLITHNEALARKMCDKIIDMEALKDQALK